MSDLKLDLAAVTELGSTLTTVAHEFADANARSDQVADAVGHHGLADRVRSFAHDWDDKRAKMTGNIKALADAASAVSQAFTDVDGQLATAIEGGQ